MKKFLKRLALLFSLVLVCGVAAILLIPGNKIKEVVKSVYNPVEAAFGRSKSINILLLGVDYNYDSKAQRYTSGARSDTILILRVEPLGKQLSMMSIPRDLMVGIGENSEHGYDRINSAFAIGGVGLTRRTVEKLTGLKIDHHVVVKSDVVADLVDAVGGVPIKVDKKMDWDDNWAGLHIHLRPGEQRLSGEEAVGYCRFRHDEDGDFGRIQRQQKFLEALLKELKQKKHVLKYNEFANIVAAKLKTDLSTKQLIGLATIYKDFPLPNLRKGRPEVEDYFANGAAYLVLAPGEPQAAVSKIFPRLPDPSVKDIAVVLEAAPSYIEEARRVASLLRNRGFGSVRLKRLTEEMDTESTLTYKSDKWVGAQVLRDLFPQLTLSKETSKGHPEVTLFINSEIFVSDGV